MAQETIRAAFYEVLQGAPITPGGTGGFRGRILGTCAVRDLDRRPVPGLVAGVAGSGIALVGHGRDAAYLVPGVGFAPARPSRRPALGLSLRYAPPDGRTSHHSVGGVAGGFQQAA